MKTIFAVAFLVGLLVQVHSLTDKQKELLAQHQKECVEKSKVDPTVLQNARKGDFGSDEKLKDHILCIAQKSDFQNSAGALQTKVIEAKLKEALKGNETRAKELVSKCAIPNTNAKLQALNAFKCIHKEASISLL